MSVVSPFSPTRLLVTGGAGFIGSSVVRNVLAQKGAGARLEKVVVLDALTYAGHLANLEGDGIAADARYTFVRGDICDQDLLAKIFAEHSIDAVLHLAAESHVDRSIESASQFVRTNVNGSFALVDAARRAWEGATSPRRFVHVSTDEVYGALGPTGYFTEKTPYAPNSPYAASKAASDLLVRSFFKTYGLPTVITNTCNNYGPRQLPEKLLPLMITNAAEGKKLPVYGEGKQIREWIHVDDHADALWCALTQGVPGESYNFGSGEEISNLEIVERVADMVDAELGRPQGTARALMTYVPDRKGHDFRYALDVSKVERELGWKATRKLGPQLLATVRWYLANAEWRAKVSTTEHQRFQAAYYAEGKRTNMSDKYNEVIKANIAVHSKLATLYAKTEPHFRPENLAVVDANLKRLVAETSAKSILDLGCGTGFMINLAKHHVKRVVGVDVTRAMLDQVDKSGPAEIELHEHDTGSFPAPPGSFDLVTAYSFLHHLYDIKPTLKTAANALRKGGRFYADLNPNFYFWDAITKLEHEPNRASFDPLVTREIDAVAHKDDQMNAEYGIPNAVLNDAEYGKNIAGGFKEDVVRATLLEVGFTDVKFTYYWYLGQALVVNDESHPKEQRIANAALVDAVLHKVMPLSRHLYKYIGFVATK